MLALKLDDVSKSYRLGQVGTGTLSHDLNRLWARLRGREDPYARVASANDRTEAGGEYVWALRGIDFEVEKGEIVGIIGRNGAGKSTLLKLLSRVTAPTTGEIRVNGRVASLLEVGTGFHPDLTGRENIYLNGAILGMTRREIASRFDEIVDFSGCAKYIDTPVKRYSSGMYVRLAFAVAAHLESDILIVDEVLAVGDAEFQAKCVGKMRDVSRAESKTVLFVSHNMAVIRQLCLRSVLMEQGKVVAVGPTEHIIERYLAIESQAERHLSWPAGTGPCSDELELSEIRVANSRGSVDASLTSADAISVEIGYRLKKPMRDLRISVSLFDSMGALIFITSDYHTASREFMTRPAGSYKSVVTIPSDFLLDTGYVAQVDFEIPRERPLIEPQRCAFHIFEMMREDVGPRIASRIPGLIHPILAWSVTRQ